MKHPMYAVKLLLVSALAVFIAGCGGSDSNSDSAPAPTPKPNVAALISVVANSSSPSVPPTSIVATFNVAATAWTSALITVSGTCTHLPTSSVALDASGKIITATLAGGTCTDGQTLTVALDPAAITFAGAVADSGTIWTRTYTIAIAAPAEHSVAGALSGLIGTVVLQNNGSDALTISTDGSFTFPTAFVAGAAYAVTVSTQPANQTCSVTNGTGTIGSADVTNVAVVCSTNARLVGGTVTGLNGSVILQNNGGDDQAINSDGAFIFAAAVAQGGTYAVTVLTQPPGQTCSVSNDSGVIGGSNINNVVVTCSTNTYTVGGTVSGLSGTVTLQNNGADSTPINSNGSFTFSTPVAEGSTYNVTVQTQPVVQTCTVTNGSGTMGGSNVTNVSVTCSTNTTTLTVSSTGTIPINVGSGSLTVTNTGTTDTAYNVSASLPGGWVDVVQDATNCTAIAPNGGTCTLSFTTTTPYVAQDNITVTGDNITSPPTAALAFSIDGYLVFSVDSPSSASVIDTNDMASTPWGSSGMSAAQSLTNGWTNTQTLNTFFGASVSAAGSCYNSTAGGVSASTWYLPAICQLGGAGQGAGCASGLANIDTNLAQLGFGGLSGDYWSSTEYSGSPISTSWFQSFASGGGSSQNLAFKSNTFNVRCARSMTY